MFDEKEHSHGRFNPLTKQWIIVSPHRTKRPWQGQVESTPAAFLPAYDASCYLCPGNARAGHDRNPDYESVFVFDNDFAALQADVPSAAMSLDGLFELRSERGICRVICFSPDHSLTLARMTPPAIRRVVDEWARQSGELAAVDFINHVQIFENRGEMMGSSNPHPHGQIWASESIPNETATELAAMAEYFATHGACLLCRYVAHERQKNERIVVENDHFIVVVPFWAVYPFETLLISKNHCGAIDDLASDERDSLADILKRLTVRYDNLFQTPFPYSMGFHQRPTDGQKHEAFHFHAHFYPPLLRSATVRKFLVGFEMLGSPQRDITPEMAAVRLQEQSEVHYAEVKQ